MKATIYLRELNRNEPIELGDLHSYDNCAPQALKDPRSVGQTPADFSGDRKFYRITDSNWHRH
jgi:hypothetical protein